jgi:hypothetical protein
MVAIKAKHPVREAFAGCSTCPGCAPYYATKGEAVSAFDAALRDHGFRFDEREFINYPGDDGRVTPAVCDEEGNCIGLALLTWYRMPSGRYEFTGYLA